MKFFLQSSLQPPQMDSILNYLNITISLSILPLLIILIFFLLFLHSRVDNSKEPPKVAGAWPILGHLPLLSGSEPLHITLGAMAEKYGPIFTIKMGATKSTLVISNWEMAKECFTSNDMVVSSRPKLVGIENLSYNLAMFGFAPYGTYWREMRKIVTLELLSNRRIELLGQVRASEVEASIKDLFNNWSKNKNEFGYVLVEMKQWFSQLTFNMVLRMIAGKRFFGAMDLANEEKAKRFLDTTHEFMRLLGVFTVGDLVPCLRWLDLGGHEKRMRKVAKELDEILREWLDEHRQKIMGLEEKDSSGDHTDFIDVMLSLLDDRKIDGFDGDTIIKATTLAMLAGGTDTTSVTLIWAVCLLVRNPHVLEKVQEELDNQIGKERCIIESDINKLVYLQSTVKETLRLYPAGPLGGPREFTDDCTLGGYNIKKGTRLMTNFWKIQTDPNIWPDPLEFKPERFLTTHKDIDVRGQDFELLPFGSGRRICPGISFSLKMVQFSLARFLHSFEILNPSNEHVDMAGTLGLVHAKATPLGILVKPRLSLKCYETM